jgi:hypothetical protein
MRGLGSYPGNVRPRALGGVGQEKSWNPREAPGRPRILHLRTTLALRLHHEGMRTLYPQKGKLPLKILRLEASIPRDLSLALPQKLPPSFIPKPLSKGSSGHLYPLTRVQRNWRLGKEHVAAPRKDELWAEGSVWGALYLSPFGEKRNCAFVVCPVLPGGLGSFAVMKPRGIGKARGKRSPRTGYVFTRQVTLDGREITQGIEPRISWSHREG